ncbi:hypothetical protein ACQP2F_13700 [Actinoplanes sp. CA-030573]
MAALRTALDALGVGERVGRRAALRPDAMFDRWAGSCHTRLPSSPS